MPRSSRFPQTSNRLRGFDYATSTSYFVTICLRTRSELFGQVSSSGILVQSPIGNMIAVSLIGIPDAFPQVDIVDFVIMPDHLHAIVELANDGEQHPVSLGTVIGRFKGLTRHRYSQGVTERGWPRYEQSLWEQGYHDHVLRHEADFTNHRRYIEENPMRWARRQRR